MYTSTLGGRRDHPFSPGISKAIVDGMKFFYYPINNPRRYLQDSGITSRWRSCTRMMSTETTSRALGNIPRLP